jgi:hypothetical protein
VSPGHPTVILQRVVEVGSDQRAKKAAALARAIPLAGNVQVVIPSNHE